MKKNLTTLFLGVFVLVAFSACSKDYTCKCTSTVAGVSTSASTTINGKKSEAKDACEAGSSETNVSGIESKVECKID